MPIVAKIKVPTPPVFILVDSSTKGAKGTHYGKSAACWAIFMGKLEGAPSHVGLIYRKLEGPNRTFYLGVIRGLIDFFELGYHRCNVEVKGDCQLVINQLTGKWLAIDLEPFYSRVKELEHWYRECRGGTIEYSYLSRNDGLYRKIDRCAQEVINFIEQRI